MNRYAGYQRHPRTWAAGDIVSYATLNTELRDQLLWCLGESTNPMPHVIVRRTENFALASGVFQAITWNTADRSRGEMFTAEDADVAAGASWGESSVLFAPVGGVIAVGGCVEIETASCNKALRLTVNMTVVAEQDTSGVGSAAVGRINVATIVPVSAGDIIELEAFQDSGGNLNVLAAGEYSPKLWAIYVAVED